MKRFDYGENIDPVELNKNFREVETLLSQAYSYNNDLRIRQEMLDLALRHLLTAADNYVSATKPDAVLYNAASTTNGPSDTFWAGNPPRLVSSITFDGSESMSNLDVVGDRLVLKSKSSYSKIPLVRNDYNERRPASGTTILLGGKELGERDLAWAILSPDLMWCYETDTSSITLQITVPPSSSPVVNHIAVNTLFPGKNYTIRYENAAGSMVELGTASISKDFYFPGDKFGGKIVLSLTGKDTGKGTWVYGISQVKASEEIFQPAGHLIKGIDLYNDATYLGGKSLFLNAVRFRGSIPAARFSDALRIQLGTALTGDSTDLADVVYDSDIHPLENPPNIDLGTGNKIWAKITLNLINKDVTPTLAGLLLEYSAGT